MHSIALPWIGSAQGRHFMSRVPGRQVLSYHSSCSPAAPFHRSIHLFCPVASAGVGFFSYNNVSVELVFCFVFLMFIWPCYQMCSPAIIWKALCKPAYVFFFSLLHHLKGTLLLTWLRQRMVFIFCWSFVPAKAEPPADCRKRGLCLPGRRFFVSAQCILAQMKPRRPHWHCCPCSQPPLGTEVARKSALGAGEQLHIGLPGSCVS